MRSDVRILTERCSSCIGRCFTKQHSEIATLGRKLIQLIAPHVVRGVVGKQYELEAVWDLVSAIWRGLIPGADGKFPNATLSMNAPRPAKTEVLPFEIIGRRSRIRITRGLLPNEPNDIDTAAALPVSYLR